MQAEHSVHTVGLQFVLMVVWFVFTSQITTLCQKDFSVLNHFLFIYDKVVRTSLPDFAFSSHCLVHYQVKPLLQEQRLPCLHPL